VLAHEQVELPGAFRGRTPTALPVFRMRLGVPARRLIEGCIRLVRSAAITLSTAPRHMLFIGEVEHCAAWRRRARIPPRPLRDDPAADALDDPPLVARVEQRETRGS